MAWKSGKNLNSEKIEGDFMMEYLLDVSFLKKGKYLWDKPVMDKMMKMFDDFRNQGGSVASERCFVEFVLELKQAYRNFLIKINDLPLIMNCRAKGDEKSHFGGEECAALMKSFRFSAEKYLNETSNKSDTSENSVYYVISQIRKKAARDEESAKKIEQIIKNEYISLGNDNTLNLFRSSGYDIGNNSIKEATPTKI